MHTACQRFWALVSTLHGCANPHWWLLHSRGLQPPDRLPAHTPKTWIPHQAGCHLRGLFRFTDSVLLRILHLLAGDPLHSASSPRCRWCTPSNAPPLGPLLEPNAPPLPLAVTAMWKPFWVCPLLTWKGPDAPFLSTIDLALSMTAASLA